MTPQQFSRRDVLKMGMGLAVSTAFGNSSANAADSSSLPPSLNEAALIEGARKEGSVTMINTGTIRSYEDVIKAFEKKYPFLKLDITVGSASDTAPKALIEAQAGRHTWDILNSDWAYLPEFKQRNLLLQYAIPTLVNWPKGTVDLEHYWVTPQASSGVLAYNTNLVPKSDVPKSFDDLLNPKWMGKIAVDAAGDGDELLSLWQYWGKEKAQDYLLKLARTKPILAGNAASRITQLAAGAFAITTRMSIGNVVEFQQRGAPIDFIKTEPIFISPSPMLMARNAPHPYAQRLLMNWYCSPQGMQIVSDARKTTLVVDPAVTGPIQTAIGKQKALVMTQDIRAHSDEAVKFMRNTFLAAAGR